MLIISTGFHRSSSSDSEDAEAEAEAKDRGDHKSESAGGGLERAGKKHSDHLAELPDLPKPTERQLGHSLFPSIDDEESPIRLLVGANKFDKGRSSWSVSSMGLMNIGRREGAQIIQR